MEKLSLNKKIQFFPEMTWGVHVSPVELSEQHDSKKTDRCIHHTGSVV